MRIVVPVLAVLALASPALAQTVTPARPANLATAPATPAGRAVHAPTPFVLALNRGADAYRRHDLAAAETAFREADGLDPQSPTPALYRGYTAMARGDAQAGMSAFREALRLATTANDDANHARAMEAIAMALEAPDHWDEARLAWGDYTAFGDAHASVSYPQVGRARAEAIQHRAQVAQEYEPVRQRIAERLRINAAGQNPDGTPRAGGPTAPPHP